MVSIPARLYDAKPAFLAVEGDTLATPCLKVSPDVRELVT